MLLLAIIVSPVVLAVIAASLFFYAKARALTKPGAGFLLGLTLLYSFVGAVASLILTVAWMGWYERTSGFSAGNAPLGWIFGYGPLSVALGQSVALIQWWWRKVD